MDITTDSRTCNENQQKYIVQRDISNWITPEYSIYYEKAPVSNIDSEKFPPAIRADTPITKIKDLFFPEFNFVAPMYPDTYLLHKFEPLTFTRLIGFTSHIFPSYSVSQNGNEIATIAYPILDEGSTLLSLLNVEKRYVIKYKDEVYITSEDVGQFYTGTFVKTLNFYNYHTGSKDDPIAIVKFRRNALGRSGLYTVCINIDMDPLFKELLFASVIAYDQHIIDEEKEEEAERRRKKN